MKKQLISEGAEAKIYLVTKKPSSTSPNKSWGEVTAGNKGGYSKESKSEPEERSGNDAKYVILKERIPKTYRHKTIDEQIRKQRTKREAKLLFKANEQKINVPHIFNTNKKGEPNTKFTLEIAYIQGDRLSHTLNSYEQKKQITIMQKIAKEVAKLHKHNIIHGDLTTSNIILKKDTVYIIDFGLGYISHKIEDKAVDLHLIKQALEAKHYKNHETLFQAFIKSYKWTEAKNIIKRLEVVEKRGRYKRAAG